MPDLNLLLCGSDAALKSLAAGMILGLDEQTEPTSDLVSACVKRETDVFGYHVTLAILPSLGKAQVSEDETLREVFECLTYCDSRVNVFLLVVQGPLSEEDKAEFGRILEIFGEEAESHCHIVFLGEDEDFAENITDIMKETQDIINIPEGCYHIFGHGAEAAQVLEHVNKLKEENSNVCYTLDMYVAAQFRKQMRCQAELEEMKMSVETLQAQNKDLQTLQGDYPYATKHISQ